MRILVLENDHANAHLFERLLRADHDVTICRYPAAARACVDAGPFDVLLVDLKMAGNGESFLGWLHDNHPRLVAHTIVVSASHDRPAHIDVPYWVPKPFDRQDLFDAVAAAGSQP